MSRKFCASGRSFLSALLLLTAGALTTAACGAGSGGASSGGSVCPAGLSAAVTRVVPHLGFGWEGTARLLLGDGSPATGQNLADCLSLSDAGGKTVTTAAVKRSAQASVSILLVAPGRAGADNDAVKALALAYLHQRPPAERIGIFRWADEVTQVSSVTSDRARLEERLASGMPAGAPSKPATEALAAVAEALGEAGGQPYVTLRTLVLVTSGEVSPIPPSALAAAAPHLVAWLGPADAAASVSAVPSALRIQMTGSDAAGAARALSANLDAIAHDGFYGFGLCGAPMAGFEGQLHAGTAKVRAVIPKVLAENRPGACDRAAVARGVRPFVRQIQINMTADERAKHDMIWQAGIGPGVITARVPPGAEIPPQPDPKEKFTFSIKLTPDSAPVKAEAHFRGDSSFRCPRHGYSVNLDGKSDRYEAFPGSAADKFHLVSMCLDRLYLRNTTTLRLLAEEGLMPVPFDIVELVTDGQSQGLYMLFEDVADSLKKSFTRTSAVLRRYKNPFGDGTFADVRWAQNDDEAAALGVYQSINDGAKGLTGEKLEAALTKHLDLDHYLSWLAMMNLLGSGDYVDEIYFYATEVTGPDGKPMPRFNVMGWDQDDMMSACHFSGRYAVTDPDGLSVCSESELDKMVLTDPRLYRRYVTIVQTLGQRVTPERFAAVITSHAQRLLQGFEDPKTLAAMAEMQKLLPTGVPLTLATARSMMQDEIELLIAQFTEHRAELLAKAAAKLKN